jgi:hypothetical protein
VSRRLKKFTAGMPNMPTLVYVLRRCGILKIWSMPSKLALVLVPNCPSAGSSAWQPLQAKAV